MPSRSTLKPKLLELSTKTYCLSCLCCPGQEEVDDIITRDINRTFPEHPFFSAEHGQQTLFRVLKAYSLHDLEVRAGLQYTSVDGGRGEG